MCPRAPPPLAITHVVFVIPAGQFGYAHTSICSPAPPDPFTDVPHHTHPGEVFGFPDGPTAVIFNGNPAAPRTNDATSRFPAVDATGSGRVMVVALLVVDPVVVAPFCTWVNVMTASPRRNASRTRGSSPPP